jgi:rhamnose utilization protein RhaD (predicted bifunctional aldolase and dehydrogenase)
MSRDSQLYVMNESGQVWQGEHIKEAKEHMIDTANDAQNLLNDKGKENKKITQNIVFSLRFQQKLSQVICLIQ